MAIVIYEGPSLIDGGPIIAVMTGYDTPSRNTKTGNLVATYILRSDVEPHHAIKEGADVSICGDCKLRGELGKGRACYVRVEQAPLNVYRKWKRGGTAAVSLGTAAELVKDRKVRLGSYGDPAAVPYRVWKALSEPANAVVGYTHAWEWCDPLLSSICMASVDTEEEAINAQELGWRTFRVKSEFMDKSHGEVVCPASKEAKKKLTCEKCMACCGNTGRKGNIVIDVHGLPHKVKEFVRITKVV